MKSILIIIFAAVGVSASASEMVFYKQNDPTIALSINDGSARIYKRQYYIDVNAGEKFNELDAQYLFVSGELVQNQQTEILTIVREEGDVCPDVEVHLLHDIVDGENQAAIVSVVDNDGGTANKLCSINLISGEYIRASTVDPRIDSIIEGQE